MSERRSDVWTKSPPTEDGYYWHRESIACAAVIRYVWRGIVKHGIDPRGSAAEYGGEWFGPLLEPGGDAVENCAVEEELARLWGERNDGPGHVLREDVGR